jgi:hypothetical protein
MAAGPRVVVGQFDSQLEIFRSSGFGRDWRVF